MKNGFIMNKDKRNQLVSYSKISFSRVAGLVSPPPRTFSISVDVKISKPLKFLFSVLEKNLFIVNKFNSLNLKNTHSIYIFRKSEKGNPQIGKKIKKFYLGRMKTSRIS
jgi:hypothetical protein